MDSPKSKFAYGLLGVVGVLCGSWGLTWGPRREFHSVGHYNDLHATLISALGAELLAAATFVNSQRKRIEALEILTAGLNQKN